MENIDYDLFELSEKQKKAFKNLKKAFADCSKLDIYFYNCYGTLGAVDYKKICDYNDTYDDNAIENHKVINQNEFKLPCNEWADDTHYFHPTKK